MIVWPKQRITRIEATQTMRRALSRRVSQLHDAEFFLRSQGALSSSRTSFHFIERERAVPYSKEPTTCPPEQGESSVHASNIYIYTRIYIYIYIYIY
jgi:hypothetical protein